MFSPIAFTPGHIQGVLSRCKGVIFPVYSQFPNSELLVIRAWRVIGFYCILMLVHGLHVSIKGANSYTHMPMCEIIL
jgi:hypothetical protein